MKDYYKTLELDKSASNSDIKKAYKQMVLIYHPDKNNGCDIKFKEISEESIHGTFNILIQNES